MQATFLHEKIKQVDAAERAFAMLFFFVVAIGPASSQEMRIVNDALDRRVEIPVQPERIVSNYDWFITTPLLEMGAPVVGSHGTISPNGRTYIRSAETVLGLSFDNTDIQFTGSFTARSYETIAALQPDLIITPVHPIAVEEIKKLEVIAPTVFVDLEAGFIESYRQIADFSGFSEEFSAHYDRYVDLIALARSWVVTSGTYSKIQIEDGALNVYGQYGNLTLVLDELGFEMTGDGLNARNNGEIYRQLSAETIIDQDADYIFGTYRVDRGASESPSSEIDEFERALPGFCEFLKACREGRFILVPRDYATAPSFEAVRTMVHLIVSQIEGRHGVELAVD